MAKLVIVESPTKAKTIKNYLPKGYKVMASMGHVRDLPQSAKDIPAHLKGVEWAKLGVDVENDFAPLYLIPKGKKKIVNELKAEIEGADELILATDEDREGESISWHLTQVLKPKVPVKRMVFHEITKEAIALAMDNCREIDEKLVRAQETRRILDRLVGYTVSPLLWKKIAYGLSAGRVQSVAVRLVVERERERRAFVVGAYWDLQAFLDFKGTGFDAILFALNGKRLAQGRDFDEHTGKIAVGKDVFLLGEREALSLSDRLKNVPWTVTRVEEKPITRNPSPPFITSTLQQEANRKLNLHARDAMRVAQGLYEKGFITYMRTDSVHLSQQAIAAARNSVERLYGKEFLSPEARQYKTKSKGAQEAHEAIRPAGAHFLTPAETHLSGRELALYDLIWKRTMATQMAQVRQTQIAIEIEAADALFKATGKRIDFAGFFRAYVEGSDDPQAAIENQEIALPKLKLGDQPRCQKIACLDHKTEPPARYTEASLVKKLESEGIGRPSTYASIISTIEDRGYVMMHGNSLVPSFTAFAVTSLLEKHFPNLVDLQFTAKMEDMLDEISTGEAEYLPYLQTFFTGHQGLKALVEQHGDEIDPDEARTVVLTGIDAKVRVGRYGAYIEVNKQGESLRASVPDSLPPAELNQEKIELIIRQKQEGPNILGKDPVTGKPVFVLTGRYGPYVQLGDVADGSEKLKRVSLPKGLKAEDVDLSRALGLLSLPRTVGIHPESGKRIFAGLGRFGPFICHDLGTEGKDYRSLKPSDGDDPVTITVARAYDILKTPKKMRGKKGAQALRQLGKHPETAEDVAVYNGPYGFYVRHKSTNASVPKDKNPLEVSLPEAVLWLKEKHTKKKKKKA